nr:periplasmic heavy metal sensor [Coralloluteibacterium stylophorae]
MVNVLLAAALATFALRGDDGPPRPPGPGGMPHPREIVEALGSGQRPLLRRAWETHRNDIRARWRDMHDARAAIPRILRQRPFEATALEHGFARLRRAESRTAAAAQAAMVDFAASLDDEGRAHLAEVMTPPEPRGHERDEERGGERRDENGARR